MPISKRKIKTPSSPERKLSFKRHHKPKWINCELCELCKVRRKVVLGRGALPADVLFIGEAPGKSEDVIGKPFKGPAGHLLDNIIAKVFSNLGKLHTFFMTNLTACIPLEDGEKLAEPTKEQIRACEPRLREVIQMAAPKLVVFVGKLSFKYASGLVGDDTKIVQIIHPAAILRMEESQRALAIDKCIITLEDGLYEI